MKSIYVYGASGHGLVVADIAKACGYNNILFIDDGENEYLSFDEIDKSNNISIILGIGNNQIRAMVFNKLLSLDMNIITLVHPSAVVSSSVIIGKGSVVMPNVVINTKTKIGNGCIINSSSVVEHENTIGNFVHISPQVALAGNVIISDYVHVGIGSSVKQGITVGENSIIGVGSVVLKNIGGSQIAYGNPCIEQRLI